MFDSCDLLFVWPIRGNGRGKGARYERAKGRKRDIDTCPESKLVKSVLDQASGFAGWENSLTSLSVLNLGAES